MKKIIYIIAFIFLGIILQFLVHGIVEILYIKLLIDDFARYSFGFSWSHWFLIHHIATVIFLIGGTIFGFWQGKFWWKKIYEKK